jgi:hypothetical protein
MKAKINKKGKLEIKRVNEFKKQSCPFSQSEPVFLCGDNCPLFGEPFITDTGVYIQLCHKTLSLSPKDFTDERGQ